MFTNKSIREVQRFASGLGLKAVVASKNKHIKLRVSAPDGRTDTLTMAVSGSRDHELKMRAHLKRFARGGAL
ncbi:MAG TPA: hypothetical protein PKZ27_03045 [Rhodocyclaceae bacterium]|nr:hypothetical protein [Burkholderiaceae bacterium]HRP74543.1 hypothetical protein [Rhodocyclaceae bacterium]